MAEGKMIKKTNKSSTGKQYRKFKDYYMVYENTKNGKRIGVYNLSDKGKEVFAVGGLRKVFKTKTAAGKKAISLIK